MLNSDFVANGGFDMLNRYMRPENNFENFVSMAEEELSIQRATLVRAAESEAIAGGGFRSSYGDAESSCINRDTYGKCLAYGPIRQPAGALRDANSAVFKSELDWIVNSKDSQDQLIGDVRLRAVSMIMDMQARALSYDVEAGAGTRQYADVGSGTKSPDDPAFPLPSSSPGSDPLCTGGDPRCTCVRNDPNFASLRDMVGEATATATLQHPELVQPAGCAGNECSVIPGQEVTFLHAICETVQGDFVLNCHPNAGSVDEIVVDLGNVTISVDVILGGSNRVRVPGQTVAACQAGVQ
jgi:hypothetical protein